MQSWKEVATEFDALGIERVGVSTDTVAQAAKLKADLSLSMRLVADPDLRVIDLYNVRAADGKTPTVATLLISADGVVRWIDVSPNYRKRNDGAFVLAAAKRVLAGAAP